MLLLESLQSTVLTYKLLMHLLDYACVQKTPLPMSLSLLLYFMKNCTLAHDPKVNVAPQECFLLEPAEANRSTNTKLSETCFCSITGLYSTRLYWLSVVSPYN